MGKGRRGEKMKVNGARVVAVSASAVLAIAATLAVVLVISQHRSGQLPVALAEEHEWKPYEVRTRGSQFASCRLEVCQI